MTQRLSTCEFKFDEILLWVIKSTSPDWCACSFGQFLRFVPILSMLLPVSMLVLSTYRIPRQLSIILSLFFRVSGEGSKEYCFVSGMQYYFVSAKKYYFVSGMINYSISGKKHSSIPGKKCYCILGNKHYFISGKKHYSISVGMLFLFLFLVTKDYLLFFSLLFNII